MTFDELCNAETAFARASRAVRMVGEHELISDLLKVEIVIQEVRHAGSTLCCTGLTPELKARVIERLLVSLFGSHHVQL